MTNIKFPYYGVRTTWFVYHPAKHGSSYTEGVWEKCAPIFMKTLNDFVDVSEIYSDEMVRSERVGGEAWHKDVMKLFNAIERDGKDVYVLEALAEAIFDRDNKLEQRVMPYHEELKKRSAQIRAEDLRLTMGNGPIDPTAISKRGWAS